MKRFSYRLGKPVRGLRQVDCASSKDQETRRLTTLRKDAGRARGRIINILRHILRRHNLQWEMPTKTFPTQRAIAWLKTLVLPEIDRLELDHLLADLEHIERRVEELDKVIAERCQLSDDAVLLASIPGAGAFTATSLACRVGRVERFPRSRSLANYWGLTPGCRNGGENNHRMGSISNTIPTDCGHHHRHFAADDGSRVCGSLSVESLRHGPNHVAHSRHDRERQNATAEHRDQRRNRQHSKDHLRRFLFHRGLLHSGLLPPASPRPRITVRRQPWAGTHAGGFLFRKWPTHYHHALTVRPCARAWIRATLPIRRPCVLTN